MRPPKNVSRIVRTRATVPCRLQTIGPDDHTSDAFARLRVENGFNFQGHAL